MGAISRFVTTVTLLAAATALVAGVWAMVSPRSFAAAVDFGEHEHFLHDVGAFQIGLGVLLLLGLIWGDALATVLTRLLVVNSLHTVAHVLDLDLGGSAAPAWSLGALSVALGAALWLHLRRLGYVV